MTDPPAHGLSLPAPTTAREKPAPPELPADQQLGDNFTEVHVPQIRACVGCGYPAAHGAWCTSCEQETSTARDPAPFTEWHGPWDERMSRAIED